MRREIKFRAWDKENEVLMYLDEPETKWEFKENGLTVSYLNEIHYEGGGEIHTKYEWEVLNCDFMQYTGLEDKNGVDIYEGDIIRYNFQTTFSNDEFISQVIFDEFMFMTDEHSLNRCSNLEVIGNIHSNPELL